MNQSARLCYGGSSCSLTTGKHSFLSHSQSQCISRFNSTAAQPDNWEDTTKSWNCLFHTGQGVQLIRVFTKVCESHINEIITAELINQASVNTNNLKVIFQLFVWAWLFVTVDTHTAALSPAEKVSWICSSIISKAIKSCFSLNLPLYSSRAFLSLVANLGTRWTQGQTFIVKVTFGGEMAPIQIWHLKYG